jgi:hypothetical protein
MKELSYNDFIIEAMPWQLAESRKWALDIRIWKYSGDQISARHFSSSDFCNTEDEAIAKCFNFGKQIIDGQISYCTVEDL